MKVALLNGNPEAADSGFDGYLAELTKQLESRGHAATSLQLRDMDIRYCIGCFGCWVKTPGECSNAADDSRTVRREYINSDLAVFASPVIMGFTSAVLKRAHDRMIGLLLPYGRLYGGETHHDPRYDKYPLMALLLQPEADGDDEDLEIITDIYRRDAINFKSSLVFSKLVTEPVEEVVDAIDRL